MQRFPGPGAVAAVTTIVALLFAADVGAAVSMRHVATRPTSALRPAVTTTTATVPAVGEADVTGRVTLLTATDAVAGPIRLPVTITVPQRGRGELSISGVTIAGEPEEIVWLAGQPLPLSGTGAIDLGPAAVTADAGGIVWHLDNGARALAPGHYFAGAPVAVGHGGLADARDSVSFDAGPGAGFVSTGDAQIRLPAAALSLRGPGGLHLSGVLTVQVGASPPRPATTLTFGPGPFVLSLQPDGTGYVVQARLQGNVTVA